MDLAGSGNNGGEMTTMLHFPSPPQDDAHGLLGHSAAQFHSQNQPFGMNPHAQARLVDNFITIRVFLKVQDDPKSEFLKKLFTNTPANAGEAAQPETTHLNQTQSLSERPVNSNGNDQVYIDVSY